MHRPHPRKHKYDDDGNIICVSGSDQNCFNARILPGSPGTGPSHDQALVEATDKINEALEEAKNSNPQGKQLAIIAEQDELFLVWVKYVDDEADVP